MHFKIKNYIKKNLYLIDKNKFYIIISVVLSFLNFIYFTKFMFNYEGIYGYTPNYNKMLGVLNYSVFIFYTICSFFMFYRTKYVRVLLYPFIWANICIGLAVSTLSMLLLIYGYHIMISIFIFFMILGSVLDIKTFKNTTVPNDYNIYQNISSTVSIWKSRISKVFGFFKSICQKIWNYFTEDIKK